MKKVLKIIGLIAALLFGLLLVALLASPLWLGPTARAIANSAVPGITGTDFNVEKISINPYTGTLRVEKLRLANPKGYDVEDAVTLDLLSVKIAPMSLFGSTISIKDITLENTYVSYVDANGTNNFEQIAANASAGKEEKEEKPEEAKEGEGKKVMIDRLSISGTRVRYGLITLPIPAIVLNGIGTSEGGVTIDSVGLQIWEKIKESFTSTGGAIGSAFKALGEGSTNLLKNVTDGNAAENVGSGAKKAAENVGSGAKKAADAVTDGAKKATDTVTDGAKKATEAIGNLFK
ncbi:MAG: AsmA family protein [Kiritimatiellae bacterium]|nr:AsmA family protein [Kiritimatiellia bacterium]